jgi:hypothetical protein
MTFDVASKILRKFNCFKTKDGRVAAVAGKALYRQFGVVNE